MPDEKKRLTDQIISEITKGKSGSSEYGDWTLYKIKLTQRKELFSWFASEKDTIPRPKDIILYMEYVENQKDNKTYYTIKKMEFGESNIATDDNYVPPSTKVNSTNTYDSATSMYVAYAKDLVIAAIPFNEELKKAKVKDLCDVVATCGKRMFEIASGKIIPAKKETPKETSKPLTLSNMKQPEDMPADENIPPMPSEETLPF